MAQSGDFSLLGHDLAAVGTYHAVGQTRLGAGGVLAGDGLGISVLALFFLNFLNDQSGSSQVGNVVGVDIHCVAGIGANLLGCDVEMDLGVRPVGVVDNCLGLSHNDSHEGLHLGQNMSSQMLGFLHGQAVNGSLDLFHGVNGIDAGHAVGNEHFLQMVLHAGSHGHESSLHLGNGSADGLLAGAGGSAVGLDQGNGIRIILAVADGVQSIILDVGIVHGGQDDALQLIGIGSRLCHQGVQDLLSQYSGLVLHLVGNLVGNTLHDGGISGAQGEGAGRRRLRVEAFKGIHHGADQVGVLLDGGVGDHVVLDLCHRFQSGSVSLAAHCLQVQLAVIADHGIQIGIQVSLDLGTFESAAVCAFPGLISGVVGQRLHGFQSAVSQAVNGQIKLIGFFVQLIQNGVGIVFQSSHVAIDAKALEHHVGGLLICAESALDDSVGQLGHDGGIMSLSVIGDGQYILVGGKVEVLFGGSGGLHHQNGGVGTQSQRVLIQIDGQDGIHTGVGRSSQLGLVAGGIALALGGQAIDAQLHQVGRIGSICAILHLADRGGNEIVLGTHRGAQENALVGIGFVTVFVHLNGHGDDLGSDHVGPKDLVIKLLRVDASNNIHSRISMFGHYGISGFTIDIARNDSLFIQTPYNSFQSVHHFYDIFYGNLREGHRNTSAFHHALNTFDTLSEQIEFFFQRICIHIRGVFIKIIGQKCCNLLINEFPTAFFDHIINVANALIVICHILTAANSIPHLDIWHVVCRYYFCCKYGS